MKKNKGMIVTFLTPAVLFFAVIFVYPIVRTLLMSFFNIEGVTDSFSQFFCRDQQLYVSYADGAF